MKYKLAVLIVSLLVSHSGFAHDVSGPQSIEHYSVDQVGKRVYVVHGPRGVPSKTNGGFMNNPAFIVGDDGVIVVDPGSSAQIGAELVKKIRSVTDKPVVAVLNTHIHGDHWLGNDGVRRAYPKAAIYAHRRMIERLKQGEGEQWVKQIESMTQGATAGTRVVIPTVGVDHGDTLRLAGVQFRFYHPGKAHSDTDIMIELVEDKALFLGDIVANRTVPSRQRPQDAYFKGQLKAIRTATELPIQLYIPGHGPSGDRSVPLEVLGFLEKLYAAVAKYYKQGKVDFEIKEIVVRELSEYKDWYGFDALGPVISRIYLEIEAESF